jgi:hypothetical protein
MLTFKQFMSENSDYRGEHTAPDKDSGAPGHDVTANGVYPKDVYSHNGFRYYGDQGNDYDREAFSKMQRMKDNPDDKVWIYRAIPKSVHKEALKTETPLKHMIRPGDWVAISKDYAREHGEGALKGDYHIASMRVPAKHIFTNGDSHHEWGYDPS